VPIPVSCPSCSAAFKVKDVYAGKRAKCPKCANPLTIPGLPADFEVVEDAPPPMTAKTKPQPVVEDAPRPAKTPAVMKPAPVEMNEPADDDTPRKKRRRDSADEDETPKKKGKGKKAKSRLPLLLGVVGGVVVLLAVIGVIVGMGLGGGGSQAKGTLPSEGLPAVPPSTSTPATVTPPTTPTPTTQSRNPAPTIPSAPKTAPTAPTAPVPTGPHRPPVIDVGLKESAAFADVSPPSKPLAPVVFFEEVDPYGKERPGVGTGLLRQELFRQALLMTAREELKLTTRDASLGEAAPDGLDDVARIRVHVRSIEAQAPRSVRVESATGDKFRTVWAAESDIATSESISNAVFQAAELSRGGYLTALKRVGGWSAEPKKVSDQPLPKSVEPALARPTVASQMYAVRTLHAHMREVGESQAALAALSRGYANLGVLTDRLWDGSTWVFKARSLLYADRLRRLEKTAAIGRWALGYAQALAGRHADALQSIANVELLGDKTPPPDWVPLVVALCKFDSASLRAKIEKHPLSEMAHLFLFLTQEEWEFPGEGIAIGEAFLKRVPECHRVSDSLARSKGLGNMRRHSQAGQDAIKTGYTEELDRVSGLPRSVFGLLQNHASLEDVLPALAASGRDAKDRSELSWAVLGRIIVESRLTLIESRMSFLRYALSVPTDEYTEEVRSVIGDHRLYPVLSVYGYDAKRQPDKAREAQRQPPINWFTTREEGRLFHRQFLTPADQEAMHTLMVWHGDDLYHDLLWMFKPIAKDDDTTIPHLEILLEISPYSPIARARLLLADSPVAKQSAEVWKKECQHGIVSVAFAKKAVLAKKYDEAERLYEWALTFTKSYFVYRQLSDLYLKRGDEEKAMLTLQESLDVPVDGLEHAQARVQIANHYLAKKEYATARKHAERAAATGAGWAMLCAASCAEGDKDMEAAEQWVRSTSERYDDSVRLWYMWCLRTGKGDVEKARQLLDDHLKKVGPPKVEGDRHGAAMAAYADGKTKDAAALFESCFTGKNTYFLVLAALLWDQAGEGEKRDRLFEKLPAEDPAAPLVKLLRDTLKKGEKGMPAEAELEEVWKKLSPSAKGGGGCYVGLFLRHRGEKEQAKKYLEFTTTFGSHGAILPAVAGVALRTK
jgi:tetratricopeptide (TPR) repeat protein